MIFNIFFEIIRFLICVFLFIFFFDVGCAAAVDVDAVVDIYAAVVGGVDAAGVVVGGGAV